MFKSIKFLHHTTWKLELDIKSANNKNLYLHDHYVDVTNFLHERSIGHMIMCGNLLHGVHPPYPHIPEVIIFVNFDDNQDAELLKLEFG